MGLAKAPILPQTIAIDTNILISAFNNPQGNSGELLDKIINSPTQVFISTLVFEEFLVKIYREKLEKDITLYEDFLTAGGLFTVVDMNRQIAKKAAQVRSNTNIKAPDAIHIATAIESKAKAFFTSDKRIPRKIENLTISII